VVGIVRRVASGRSCGRGQVVRRVRWLRVKVVVKVVDQHIGPTLSQTRHPPKRGWERHG